ncbi:MAG: hypothetical protein OXC19_24415 [Bryobacterales bacterium]|nr:hypothetical protein [Bryobacterales bacterium]
MHAHSVAHVRAGTLCAVLLGAATLLPAQQVRYSGPQSGESLEPFSVLAVNGPEAGTEVDFISRWGEDPMLIIFLHQLDRNIAALLRPCEWFAHERAEAGLKSLIVFLHDDKIFGERRMQAVVKSMGIRIPVGVSVEGVEGPGPYGLNKSVAITILVAKNRKVTDNYAIVQAGVVDAPKVLESVAVHVGGDVDKLMARVHDADQRAMMARRARAMQAEQSKSDDSK